jgi:hypothetical protein
MKTVKQILLISLLAIPTIANAAYFGEYMMEEARDKKIRLSSYKSIRAQIDYLLEKAYYYQLNGTTEYTEVDEALTIMNINDKATIIDVMEKTNTLSRIVQKNAY